VRLALIIFFELALLVAVIAAIGAALPRGHVASRSRVVRGSPAEVYAIVRDVASAPQWRSDVKRVEILDATHFCEYSKHHAITYEIAGDEPARSFVTRIVDTDLGYSGSWTWRFEPDSGGTRVTITENGEVSNVIFRFLSKFVFGYTGTMEKTLAALSAKCDTAPHPSAAPNRAR
jgi:polyketide cyclase/dehydrase/lipid transport protein